jgi:hypothetical protein
VHPVEIEPEFDDSGYGVDNPVAEQEAVDRARRMLSGEAGAGSPSGFEALAWYCSFHDCPEGWGIYVPLSSLHLFDRVHLADLPLSRTERWQVAWSAIIAHEQMHFLVDLGISWIELLMTAPMRLELTERISNPPQLKTASLEVVGPHYLACEEALANGFMLREAVSRYPAEVVQRLLDSVRIQPIGYREGEHAATDGGFADAAAETFRSYLATWAPARGLDPGNPGIDFVRLLPGDDATRTACPVHIINDLVNAGLPPGAVRLILCIREIEESDRFRRSLHSLPAQLQQSWKRRKEQVRCRLPSPPRFEKLKGELAGLFSLRLRDGYRVHLEPPPRGGRVWRAISVGTHKEMGHG